MNTPTPEFEQAAFDCFIAGLGNEALDAFRELVRLYRFGATMQAAAWLNLSENDTEIFRAVAHRLHREILAEQPA